MDATMIVYGYLERETVTGELRSRLFHAREDLWIEDGDGVYHTVKEGALLLVVDRSGAEQPLVEQLVDANEHWMHLFWGMRHNYQETRTPLDLRTPESGGRETPAIPF